MKNKRLNNRFPLNKMGTKEKRKRIHNISEKINHPANPNLARFTKSPASSFSLSLLSLSFSLYLSPTHHSASSIRHRFLFCFCFLLVCDPIGDTGNLITVVSCEDFCFWFSLSAFLFGI